MCACGEEYWIHYHGTQVSYVTGISSSCVCLTLLRELFFFLPSLPIYLSLCVIPSFSLCGMCTFVYSELDCLLPRGEGLMVLLSNCGEMDSSSKPECEQTE